MENSSDSREENFKLWVLLRQTRDAIHIVRAKELRQQGISSRQAAILFCINGIGKETTPAEVARWQLREPHSISEILSRMEKQGLITKTKDMVRKNLVRVTNTEKGQQAYHQSLQGQSIQNVMSCLSRQERKQLMSYLKRLRRRALEEMGTNREPPFP